MHPLIEWAVAGTTLLAVVAGAASSLLDQVAGRAVLVTAGLAELAALVQSVVAGIGLARGHDVPSTATFVGYLVGILVVIPFAVVWAWADRNRWSGAVVALGALTVAVMTARLDLMWSGRA